MTHKEPRVSKHNYTATCRRHPRRVRCNSIAYASYEFNFLGPGAVDAPGLIAFGSEEDLKFRGGTVVGPERNRYIPRLRILRHLRVRTRVRTVSLHRAPPGVSSSRTPLGRPRGSQASKRLRDRNTVANAVVGLNHIKARPSTGDRKPGLLLQIVPYGEFRAPGNSIVPKNPANHHPIANSGHRFCLSFFAVGSTVSRRSSIVSFQILICKCA